MQASHPKILLVVGGTYNRFDVGEQFLDIMLSDHPRDRVIRYSTVPVNTPEQNIHWHGSAMVAHPTRYSNLPVVSSYREFCFRKFDRANCVSQIEQLIAEEKIELVWFVLNQSSIVQIAAALQRELNVPFVAHVWDTPEYLGFKMRLDPVSQHRLLDDFAKTIQNARGVVTVSQPMTETYRQRYGVESRPMVFCPPLENWLPLQMPRENHDRFRIVFAGSLYCWREWNAFLDAVELRVRSNAKQKIEVVCIGNQSRWAKPRDWVEYLPIQPAAEAAKMINGSDLAYLPYWMDKRHRFFVNTAFPSKLPFYTAAGTPVFFHGPEQSTPAAFLNEYPLGVCCHSLEPTEICSVLDRVIDEKGLFEKYPKIRELVLENVFHPDRCVEIFEQTVRSALNLELGKNNQKSVEYLDQES